MLGWLKDARYNSTLESIASLRASIELLEAKIEAIKTHIFSLRSQINVTKRRQEPKQSAVAKPAAVSWETLTEDEKEFIAGLPEDQRKKIENYLNGDEVQE